MLIHARNAYIMMLVRPIGKVGEEKNDRLFIEKCNHFRNSAFVDPFSDRSISAVSNERGARPVWSFGLSAVNCRKFLTLSRPLPG